MSKCNIEVQLGKLVELKDTIENINYKIDTFTSFDGGIPHISVSYSAGTYNGGFSTYQLNLPDNMRSELVSIVINYLRKQKAILIEELTKYTIQKTE